MTAHAAGQRSAVETALLEYQRLPGRHALGRQQPQLLFASIKDILQLAAGRSPEGGGGHAPSQAVQHAASFFVRAALLFPDADHYALLGLPRHADTAAVRERYRLMMRLMHPDFAAAPSSVAHWPEDAAARVNRAYEILSSPMQRAAYDKDLAEPTATRRAEPQTRRSLVKVPPAVRAPAPDPRRRLKQLAGVFGAAGGLALGASIVTEMTADKETLVQRPAASPATSSAPGQREISAPLDLAAAAPLAIDALVAMIPFGRPAPAPAPVPVKPAAPSVAVMPMPAYAAPAAPAEAAAAPPRLPAILPPVPSVPPPPSLPMAALPAIKVAVAPNPGLTLAEAHPLLSKLLQQMESGSGDRVLGLLDVDARAAPGAQALLLHYNSLVDGIGPVQLSDVRFKAEPRDGRLVVTGRVLMQLRDQAPGAPPRPLALQAEFASRDGTVVLTRLARAQE